MDEKVAPGSSCKRLIKRYLPIVAVGSLWKFMENENNRFQELPSATCDFWLGLHAMSEQNIDKTSLEG